MGIQATISQLRRPRRMVITMGMPYANGPVHLGHLGGCHVPADIYARWCRMLIGAEKVLFVCGTDDHGSTSEVAALKAGVPVREFIEGLRAKQTVTLGRYGISLDVYTGTSAHECFPIHAELSKDFVTRLYNNGMLEKRISRQWYDPLLNRFLPDRYVRGRCPNPKCANEDAYSDECDVCGRQHAPTDLINPRSAISEATPVMRDTAHWFLDMWAVSETLRTWIQGKTKTWRPYIVAQTLEKVMPALRFDNVHEPAFKGLRDRLPKHKSKYDAGKKIVVQFGDKRDLEAGRAILEAAGIPTVLSDEWGHRPITRDIAWGLPLPALDPDLAGKTLYVWPDSLIAPIAFTQVALRRKGLDPALHREFWCDPDARVVQFLGQDNIFFYVIMQGALWLGTQKDPHRLPQAGEWQMTDIIANCHVMVAGEKMSKSRGNFFTGDQLLDEKGYTADQVRYYLAMLALSEKPADFDVAKLDERNSFLGGPMNAAFEKPIAAALSKFGGRVPEGVLMEKVIKDTETIVARYARCMEKADYPNLLFEIENYARAINSLFTQFKPHDDRFPEEARRNALYSSFYVLKTLMIMLYPFVPETMDRLRQSLRLPETVWRVEELGTPIPAGHEIGPKLSFFPAPAHPAT